MNEYALVITAAGAMALLLLIQILVADVLGVVSRHTPGTPVEPDHGNALFRATRTVANSNEIIAVFILAVLFCMLSGASSQYTGYAAWGFVAARTLYALCYYFNFQIMRSVVFGVSLAFLAALIGIGILA